MTTDSHVFKHQVLHSTREGGEERLRKVADVIGHVRCVIILRLQYAAETGNTRSTARNVTYNDIMRRGIRDLRKRFDENRLSRDIGVLPIAFF